jgi:hypothetical protein
MTVPEASTFGKVNLIGADVRIVREYWAGCASSARHSYIRFLPMLLLLQ